MERKKKTPMLDRFIVVRFSDEQRDLLNAFCETAKVKPTVMVRAVAMAFARAEAADQGAGVYHLRNLLGDIHESGWLPIHEIPKAFRPKED